MLHTGLSTMPKDAGLSPEQQAAEVNNQRGMILHHVMLSAGDPKPDRAYTYRSREWYQRAAPVIRALRDTPDAEILAQGEEIYAASRERRAWKAMIELPAPLPIPAGEDRRWENTPLGVYTPKGRD